MKPACVAKARSLNPQRDKAVDNGVRYGAMKAPSPAVPTATPSVRDNPTFFFAEARFHARLTNLAGRNIITAIRGSTRTVADIKSEGSIRISYAISHVIEHKVNAGGTHGPSRISGLAV